MLEINQAARLLDSFQVRSALQAQRQSPDRAGSKQEVSLGKEFLMLLSFGESCPAILDIKAFQHISS